VQQRIKLELVVNLKTAKAIGGVVPTSLLLGADRAIEQASSMSDVGRHKADLAFWSGDVCFRWALRGHDEVSLEWQHRQSRHKERYPVVDHPGLHAVASHRLDDGPFLSKERRGLVYV
jgi:hypothetical protein